MTKITLIAHNIRSSHNIGSMLRTADGLGIHKVYLTGYSPYPKTNNDERLPHIYQRLEKQIDKTALGAQNSVDWQHVENLESLFNELREESVSIVALEQSVDAKSIEDFSAPDKIALVVGNETEGIDKSILDLCDDLLEIPMMGAKESFNVSVATAIALYSLSKA